MDQDALIQRQYYAATAAAYDDMHVAAQDEHMFALHLLSAYINFHRIRSVLDVGAGTGRTILSLRERHPDLIVRGVEPVQELREQAHQKGVSREDLLDGDAYALPFADNSFDLVCEFAVLHHVKEPRRMIAEMTRVAGRMIAVSDCNFMAGGSLGLRLLKYGLFVSGLWRAADLIKTKGKGYTISEEDGLAYSYSVFESLPQIKADWRNIRLTATRGQQGSRLSQMLTADQFLVVGYDKASAPSAVR